MYNYQQNKYVLDDRDTPSLVRGIYGTLSSTRFLKLKFLLRGFWNLTAQTASLTNYAVGKVFSLAY